MSLARLFHAIIGSTFEQLLSFPKFIFGCRAVINQKIDPQMALLDECQCR